MKETYKDCEVEIYYVTQRATWPDSGDAFVIVAKEGYGHTDWRAYCGLVTAGTDDNWQAVLEHGSKVRRELAEFLFPDFKKKYKWRK